MRTEYALYIPIAKAIVKLFHPFVEVVIHDLETNTIQAIFNNYSQRKEGETSLLEENERFEQAPETFGPYYKTHHDGSRIKSVTASIKDSQNKTIGLFCINFALGPFDEMLSLVTDLEETLPKELFSEDWREKISHFVRSELKSQGKSLKSLTKEDKKELVLNLYREGAFKAKNAAQYIADILELSRATVYKYLKEHDDVSTP